MPAYAEQNQAFLIRAIQCYVHVMKRINILNCGKEVIFIPLADCYHKVYILY